jgi:hypothetical protein
VTISYVELAASTHVRRLALKDQYYFDCDCVRCIASETQNGSREDAFVEGYRCINTSCEGPLMPDPGDSKKLICDLCGLNRHEADLTPLALEAEKIVLEASAMYNSGSILLTEIACLDIQIFCLVSRWSYDIHVYIGIHVMFMFWVEVPYCAQGP